ncbi:hypothetical protein D3879_01535 [Pseudomonas cavernicola]|uniref:Uncharacterized protein n=1 Tax=Pseudomonas cavernicola TaxID=2320866 RepID=A0A418XHV7_9PSED|nr:hypothetical protein [Pseudomonas cavernicola]RJG12036.1 hypothetical protein D3879_01535 [Pseudomonas cavernicola]
MWTVKELISFLDRKGISTSSYGIYEEKNEAFCLQKSGEEWVVYYSERGNRNELGWGKTEAQALDILKLFLLESHKKI